MELSPLPVILLLISVLLVAQAQGTHKAVVSIKPDRHVFIGETVNLRCEVQVNASQLTYSWYKNTKSFTGDGIDVAIDSLMPNVIIWSVKHSESGNYTCRGKRKDSQSSEISNAVTLIVSGKPKPTVRVNPQSFFYTGDTVTLICELQQGTGWEFQWYKKPENLQHQNTEHPNILKVTAENAGETVYQCRAHRINYKSKYYPTDLSDPVSITAKERPQAVLSVSPQNWLTEGDSVTLSCEVTDSSTDWTFSWYTVVPYRDGVTQIKNTDYVMYVELLSNNSRGSGGFYTLSPSALHHTGVYVCRGERGEPVSHTLYSNPQPLWISGESPPVSLIISPSRTQHFT
ncbi:leukocyte immunoglobulin-like receptor subfamily B member 2, partial [Silurus meridionalis]|uniref:leukocyte immunoglobulin-like receptor subfamily B member 2 n=1 Tax=Silurus meridionalis TaxID=175797 RepID=UPI001EEC478D